MVVNRQQDFKEVEVWLASDYLEKMDIITTEPITSLSRFEPGRVVYRFNSGNRAGQVRIVIKAKAMRIGKIRAHCGILNGEVFTFEQFAYP